MAVWACELLNWDKSEKFLLFLKAPHNRFINKFQGLLAGRWLGNLDLLLLWPIALESTLSRLPESTELSVERLRLAGS